MKKFLILILAFALAFATTMVMADDKPDSVTYFQHQPSQVLQPFTLFNPAITEHKNGKVTKSFFQHQPSKTFPAGSLFNPLVTTTEKEPKK